MKPGRQAADTAEAEAAQDILPGESLLTLWAARGYLKNCRSWDGCHNES